jgi:hypothetical protein
MIEIPSVAMALQQQGACLWKTFPATGKLLTALSTGEPAQEDFLCK